MLNRKTFDAALEAHAHRKRRLLDTMIKGKADFKAGLVK